MDPADAFSASLFKWDPRNSMQAPPPPPTSSRLLEAQVTPSALIPPLHHHHHHHLPTPPPPPPLQQQQTPYSVRPTNITTTSAREQLGLGGLEDLFQAYGIRYYTAAKIAELGFTMNTLLHMKDEELDDMMNSLSQIFRWDLLVGERYGIKAAVRAERRRIEEEESRRRHLLSSDTTNTLDALSQEGLSEEPVQQQEKEVVGSGSGVGLGMAWEACGGTLHVKKQRRKKKGRSSITTTTGANKMASLMDHNDHGDDDIDDQSEGGADQEDEHGSGGSERQREHPFIVTEPGEVARGKKNGLDYLFHLYEQCREFLIQVQNISKERGEKCPTKVTNQVFRYAKKAGASYINKPKMRHYVHCYALHCLDEEASNVLRRAFKERGENVGAWRQACYKPLVSIAARQGWDIDAIFNAHPRLSIWYVPTKLRQLCHAERSSAAAAAATAASSSGNACADHRLHF